MDALYAGANRVPSSTAGVDGLVHARGAEKNRLGLMPPHFEGLDLPVDIDPFRLLGVEAGNGHADRRDAVGVDDGNEQCHAQEHGYAGYGELAQKGGRDHDNFATRVCGGADGMGASVSGPYLGRRRKIGASI